jgi:hypothetical protein
MNETPNWVPSPEAQLRCGQLSFDDFILTLPYIGSSRISTFGVDTEFQQRLILPANQDEIPEHAP